MRLFADASAVVAIIAIEPDREVLLQRLALAKQRLWSAMTCWETVSALRNSHELSIAEARHRVEHFGQAFQLQIVPIAATELSLALDAYAAYGRKQHQAKLNFGDCFAYACAKSNDAELLYKGNDFAKTDLA